MSFYFAFLVCAACGALVITLAGFAVFVWLQVLNELEDPVVASPNMLQIIVVLLLFLFFVFFLTKLEWH